VRRAVHGRLVRAIQRGELFDVSRSVGGVGILVVRVKLLQSVGDRAHQCFGVLQRQPDVLVSFLPMVVAHQLVKNVLYGKRVLHKKRIGLGAH